MSRGIIAEARDAFHAGVREQLLWFDEREIATNADAGSKTNPNTVSIAIAGKLAALLGVNRTSPKLAGQTQGTVFEKLIEEFLRATFVQMQSLRPGSWTVGRLGLGGEKGISNFEQYGHLAYLARAANDSPELAAALGRDYQIEPDAVIFRSPESDEYLNDGPGVLVDDSVARWTPLRKVNGEQPILHACVSCKWTLRSDRAQNVRTEALNLIRNRKGALPHIVAVTAEPMPGRIASLALGTGDVDCVYHFALPELQHAVLELGFADSETLLRTMVDGRRLRDISDLPLDLAI